MKTSSRKAKGREFQSWVARKIADVIGLEFGKDKDIASREMGQSGTDIRLSPLAISIFPFSIECKNQKTWHIHKDIKQAKANTLPNTNWLLFYKRTSRKVDERISPVVVIDAEVFFNLIRELYEKKEKIDIS